MKATTLPGFEAVWYMCYYFKWGTSDYISRQMMDFKADLPKQIRTFSSMAAEEFHGLEVEVNYVIRVLGSGELIATKPNRVRDVAIGIANELECPYRPHIIKKNRATKPLKSLGKEARKAEMEGVYELNESPDLNEKTVLVVDDIFTFGTCMEAIGNVLKLKYPRVKLFGFAIARNWERGAEGISINEKAFIEKYVKIKAKI